MTFKGSSPLLNASEINQAYLPVGTTEGGFSSWSVANGTLAISDQSNDGTAAIFCSTLSGAETDNCYSACTITTNGGNYSVWGAGFAVDKTHYAGITPDLNPGVPLASGTLVLCNGGVAATAQLIFAAPYFTPSALPVSVAVSVAGTVLSAWAKNASDATWTLLGSADVAGTVDAATLQTWPATVFLESEAFGTAAISAFFWGPTADLTDVTVPNVIGMALTVGEAALTAAGFSAGTVSTAYSETMALGSISAQSVTGPAPLGTTVALTESLGPYPSTTVPNVVGLALAAGETAITAAQLVTGTITEEYSATVLAGLIVSQVPPAGTVVELAGPPGFVANLSVAVEESLGPAPIGSSIDIAARLDALLPIGWFEGLVPVKEALIAGIATALEFIYQLFGYVRLQTRIGTATDGFLELIAQDFLGTTLPRESGEIDALYANRIKSGFFPRRNTRADVIRVVTQLTGNAPLIVEPQRPADLGGYGIACGYSVAGRLGSLALPYQMFLTVARGTSVSDASLYAAIAAVQPIATIVWVKLL